MENHQAHNLIEDDTQIHGYDSKLDFENNETLSSNISINLEQRDRAMTLGSFRDRAFTLGSEFDLSTDPGFGDSLLMTGNHTADGNLDHITPSGTVISVTSTSSYRGPAHPGINVVNGFSLGIHSTLDRNLDSTRTNFPQDRVNNPLLSSQTTTTELETSYELNNFGKRPKSGIGRLRAMSDLDIDGNQKAILKDMIIAGDNALQAALDQYEQGDTAQLEQMIKSGALNNKLNSDIDILGDLDLDFLNVHEDMGPSYSGSLAVHTANKSASIHIKRMSDRSQSSDLGVDRTWMSRDRASSYSTATPSYADDGIGELEFNADYPGATDSDDYLQLVGSSFQSQQLSTVPPSHNFTLSRSELIDTSRYRSNSLAFGGIIDEPVSDDEQTPVGRWMDRTLPVEFSHTESSKPLKKRISAGLTLDYNSSSIQPKRETRLLVRTRSDLVAERKREREEKKVMKEREREEKLLQKSKLMRDKKKEEDIRKDKKSTPTAALKSTEKNKKKKRPPILDDQCSSEEHESEDQLHTVAVSGSGRPRTLSDPNLSVTIDEFGLLDVSGPRDWVGAYSPDSRKVRIERFLAKRGHRVWIKKVKYDVRKNFADSRLRVKGRFVKKEDELLMRDLMSLT